MIDDLDRIHNNLFHAYQLTSAMSQGLKSVALALMLEALQKKYEADMAAAFGDFSGDSADLPHALKGN